VPQHPQARLISAETPRDAWEEVIGPWFRTHARAWREELPVVALVPSRAYAAYLRDRLLREDGALLGVRLVTPSDLFSLLWSLRGDGRTPAPREAVLLVMAGMMSAAPGRPAGLAAAADLYEAYQALVTAGWEDFSRVLPPPAAALLQEMEGRLQRVGLISRPRAVRRLAAAEGEPVIGSLLIAGFDASHWHDYPLLRAAAAAAREVTAVFFTPRYHAQRLDQLWLGTWEEVFGPAETAGGEAAGPLQPLAALFSGLEGEARPNAPVEFRVAAAADGEAAAAVLAAIGYLSQSPEARIGILVPGYGALSREIVLRLAAAGVKFNDFVGRNDPPPGDEQRWRAWLALQREPRVRQLVEALNTGLIEAELSAGLGGELEEAMQRVMGDSLPLLAAAAAEPPPLCRWPHLPETLAALPLLPDSDTLSGFAEKAERSLSAAGLARWAAGLQEAARELQPALDEPISREAFLGWLEAHRAVNRWSRPVAWVVPYARIHVLPYSRAAWQEWTHLVCTGLNQDLWPALPPPRPYLPEQALAELNRQAVGTGSQGEGHPVLREGYAYLTGTHDEQVLARRLFAALLEECGSAVCLTCSRNDERDPSRRRVPGDIFSGIYFCCRGRPLTEAELDRLQAHTEQYITQSVALVNEPPPPPELPPPEKAAAAFLRRRDPERPFDQYTFCLSRPPPQPLRLHAKEWEEALQHPPLVWMRRLLGVEPLRPRLEAENWAVTVGTLVHEWLGGALRRTGSRNEAGDPRGILAAVDEEFSASLQWLERTYRAAGMVLPEGIRWMWHEARRLAEEFAARLADHLREWPEILAEYTLPRQSGWQAEDGRRLHLAGRLDVLLRRRTPEGLEYWVVDFKTGAQRSPLTARRLATAMRNGEGLQAVLYALGLPEGSRVYLSLLLPGHPLRKQVSRGDILEQKAILYELIRMQDEAVFGMRREVRSEYVYTPEYPIATLPVAPEVLDRKWELTHPALGRTGAGERGEEE